MPKLQPITFTLTPQQLKWLKQQSEKTGLHQVEIVRRALDAYADAEEIKEQRRYFSEEQRQNIRDIARRRGDRRDRGRPGSDQQRSPIQEEVVREEK